MEANEEIKNQNQNDKKDLNFKQYMIINSKE